MKYSKKHILAIEARLQEYEDEESRGFFMLLSYCNVCKTLIPKGNYIYDCRNCLFSNDVDDCDNCGCYSKYGAISTGHYCETKAQQRRQYAHLLKRLDENGYEFK